MQFAHLCSLLVIMSAQAEGGTFGGAILCHPAQSDTCTIRLHPALDEKPDLFVIEHGY